MRRLAVVLLVLICPAGAALAAGELVAGASGLVVEVVDGDTVVLEDGTEVRLVGIQAPQPNFRLFHKMLGVRVGRITTRLPPNHFDRAFFSASSVRAAASCSIPGRR